MNIDDIRTQTGVVNQEPRLFAMSIADNIVYGLEDTSRSQVEGAARDANAHGFITDFDDGYDTYVGELGSRLSGGQRQVSPWSAWPAGPMLPCWVLCGGVGPQPLAPH